MLKKPLILTVLVGLVLSLLLVTPTFAQENWSAYFYSTKLQAVIRVYADGSQETYPLDIAQGIHLYDPISDGTHLASCLTEVDTTSDPITTTTTLYLRDIAAQSNLFTLPARNCFMDSLRFSDDSHFLAVSQVNYYPDQADADISQPTWQLQLFDIGSGNVIYDLNVLSPAVAAYDDLAKSTAIISIKRITDHQVTFAAIPYTSSPQGLTWHGYQWDLDSGTVTPMPLWDNDTGESDAVDSLPAINETVYVTKDANRPSGKAFDPLQSKNVVKVIDSTGLERTIFHSPDWLIEDVKYIDDGMRIIIQLFPSYDPYSHVPDKWVALDRAGHIEELGSDYQYVVAAPGGYLSLTTDYNPQVTGSFVTSTWTYHSSGRSTEFFSSGSMAGDSVSLLGFSPSVTSADLPPFPAIG